MQLTKKINVECQHGLRSKLGSSWEAPCGPQFASQMKEVSAKYGNVEKIL
jgi:hypothetical protein